MKISNVLMPVLAAASFGLSSCDRSPMAADRVEAFAKVHALHGVVKLPYSTFSQVTQIARDKNGAAVMSDALQAAHETVSVENKKELQVPIEVMELYIAGNLNKESIVAAQKRLGFDLVFKKDINQDPEWCETELHNLLATLSRFDIQQLRETTAATKAAFSVSFNGAEGSARNNALQISQ